MNDDSFRLTSVDVKHHDFRPARLGGYEKSSVEEFRDRVAEECERGSVERSRELPAVALADDERPREQHVTFVVLGRERVHGHPRLVIPGVDGGGLGGALGEPVPGREGLQLLELDRLQRAAVGLGHPGRGEGSAGRVQGATAVGSRASQQRTFAEALERSGQGLTRADPLPEPNPRPLPPPVRLRGNEALEAPERPPDSFLGLLWWKVKGQL